MLVHFIAERRCFPYGLAKLDAHWIMVNQREA